MPLKYDFKTDRFECKHCKYIAPLFMYGSVKAEEDCRVAAPDHCPNCGEDLCPPAIREAAAERATQ